MSNLLETLAIGFLKARYPKDAKYFEDAELARKLIRAKWFYERNRKNKMDATEAATKAATDAGLDLNKFLQYLAGKTGAFGEVAISTVLAGSQYSDPNKTNFNFQGEKR